MHLCTDSILKSTIYRRFCGIDFAYPGRVGGFYKVKLILGAKTWSGRKRQLLDLLVSSCLFRPAQVLAPRMLQECFKRYRFGKNTFWNFRLRLKYSLILSKWLMNHLIYRKFLLIKVKLRIWQGEGRGGGDENFIFEGSEPEPKIIERLRNSWF